MCKARKEKPEKQQSSVSKNKSGKKKKNLRKLKKLKQLSKISPSQSLKITKKITKNKNQQINLEMRKPNLKGTSPLKFNFYFGNCSPLDKDKINEALKKNTFCYKRLSFKECESPMEYNNAQYKMSQNKAMNMDKSNYYNNEQVNSSYISNQNNQYAPPHPSYLIQDEESQKINQMNYQMNEHPGFYNTENYGNFHTVISPKSNKHSNNIIVYQNNDNCQVVNYINEKKDERDKAQNLNYSKSFSTMTCSSGCKKNSNTETLSDKKKNNRGGSTGKKRKEKNEDRMYNDENTLNEDNLSYDCNIYNKHEEFEDKKKLGNNTYDRKIGNQYYNGQVQRMNEPMSYGYINNTKYINLYNMYDYNNMHNLNYMDEINKDINAVKNVNNKKSEKKSKSKIKEHLDTNSANINIIKESPLIINSINIRENKENMLNQNQSSIINSNTSMSKISIYQNSYESMKKPFMSSSISKDNDPTGSKDKSKKLFECTETSINANTEHKLILPKRKRYRKNTNQICILNDFYEANKTWSKTDVANVARKVGLKENKVYKWLWDRKNKEMKMAKFIVNKAYG